MGLFPRLLTIIIIVHFAIASPLWDILKRLNSLSFPEICDSDKRLDKDKIYHAIHSWNKFHDADTILCQMEEAFKTAENKSTPYTKCVNDLRQNKMDGDNTTSMAADSLSIKQWRDSMKPVLMRDADFAQQVAICSRQLTECSDAKPLRKCMLAHPNYYLD